MQPKLLIHTENQASEGRLEAQAVQDHQAGSKGPSRYMHMLRGALKVLSMQSLLPTILTVQLMLLFCLL